MIVLILKFSSILLQTVLEGNTEEYTTDLATIGATFLGLYSSAPPKHALHNVPCTYMGHIILLLSQGGLVEYQSLEDGMEGMCTITFGMYENRWFNFTQSEMIYIA